MCRGRRGPSARVSGSATRSAAAGDWPAGMRSPGCANCPAVAERGRAPGGNRHRRGSVEGGRFSGYQRLLLVRGPIVAPRPSYGVAGPDARTWTVRRRRIRGRWGATAASSESAGRRRNGPTAGRSAPPAHYQAVARCGFPPWRDRWSWTGCPTRACMRHRLTRVAIERTPARETGSRGRRGCGPRSGAAATSAGGARQRDVLRRGQASRSRRTSSKRPPGRRRWPVRARRVVRRRRIQARRERSVIAHSIQAPRQRSPRNGSPMST